MLNTPRVSLAGTQSNAQMLPTQISLGVQQNWGDHLEQFNNEQNTTAILTDITDSNNTDPALSDANNMVVRADTLDRIPVFVNPHDLNETRNVSQENQEMQVVVGNDFSCSPSEFNKYIQQQENTASNSIHSDQESQQVQIKLANTNNTQVHNYYCDMYFTK